MFKKQLQEIKKAQKESLLLRELSKLFLQLTLDDKELENLTISKIKLSADKSVCTVFFYTQAGPEDFEKRLARLKLYKPSLRKALSQTLALRHTPDLIFKYDKQIEKQHKIEKLLNKIKTEEQL
ncbi:30S ribosome-binding factor RbfA [Candidatus Dependentiae bacterium]|nr:MAG: 30S ribosome-binding factor RbfA [Candidatus Dependentiae bacterium]